MINKHNEKMMSQYGYLALIIPELDGKLINYISFTPFDNMPINRKFDLGNAYQIKDLGNNKIDIYYEPNDLYPGNRIIFIKDIPEKGIKKGDKGEIERISSSLTRLEIVLDRRDENGHLTFVKGISPFDCVYDPDYKFAHFCKVSTADRGYVSEDGNGFTHGSHFTDASTSVIYSIRYKGVLNKEMAINIREQFIKEKPGLVKLEEDGKWAFLLMDRYPGNNGKDEPREIDMYRRPRKYTDLIENQTIKNKLKM